MCAVAARNGSRLPQWIEDPQVAPPERGDVLCRTLELGVCGTDREILESERPWTPPDSDYLILGHECLARVEAVGADADGVRAGDLVVPVVRRPLPGAAHRVDMLAFDSYTERGIAREHGFSCRRWLDRPEHLFHVSEEIAPVAVLTEPITIAEKGVNEALIVQRARLGEDAWTDPPPRVLITGMGPIAFAAVLVATCHGWPVSVYGRDPRDSFRARLVAAFGARYLAAADEDLTPADPEANGFELIIECTGSDEVMVRASGSLAARGAMVWLGSSRVAEPKTRNVALMMRNSLLRNHVHIGCVNAAPRDFADALRHLEQAYRQDRNRVEALITARVSPTRALPHYERREPQGIKTVVQYE